MGLTEFKDKEGGASLVEVERFRTPRLHDNPRSGSFELVYGRMPGRTNLGRPPLLFLTGGPGDSPLAWLSHPHFRRAFEELAEYQDLILLDQRGCGRSEPRWELPPLQGEDILLSEPDAMAALTVQADPLFQEAEVNPLWLTPWESARDLPLLAKHLGTERLDILSVSYGTHLGMALMKAAPGLIRRAVFCGFEGPDQTWKRPGAFERQLDLLGEPLEVENLAESVRVLVLKADEEPFILGDGRRVGGFGLRWMLSSWLGLAIRFSKLPELVQSLEASETGHLQRLTQGFLKSLERPAAFYLKDLASSASEARLTQLNQEAAKSWMGSVNFPFPAIRPAWGQPPLPDWFRAAPNWDGPLLVLTGSLDCFTPTSNVLEAGAHLTRMTHLELSGVAHDQFLGNPAAMSWIKKHLEGV